MIKLCHQVNEIWKKMGYLLLALDNDSLNFYYYQIFYFKHRSVNIDNLNTIDFVVALFYTIYLFLSVSIVKTDNFLSISFCEFIVWPFSLYPIWFDIYEISLNFQWMIRFNLIVHYQFWASLTYFNIKHNNQMLQYIIEVEWRWCWITLYNSW